MKKKLYRQGDVLLMRVAAVTKGKDLGKPILALGEKSGHMHKVFAPTKQTVVEFFQGVNAMAGTQFVEVIGRTAELRHVSHSDTLTGEHATVRLPIGTYRLIPQMEYTPQAIRRVQD